MTVRLLARSRSKVGCGSPAAPTIQRIRRCASNQKFGDARSGNVRRAAQFRPRCHGRRTTNDRDPSENHAQRTSLDRSGKVRLKMDRGMKQFARAMLKEGRTIRFAVLELVGGRVSGFVKSQWRASGRHQDGDVDSGMAAKRSCAATRQTEPRCVYVRRSPCSSSTARIASGGWEYPRKLLPARRMTRLKQT